MPPLRRWPSALLLATAVAVAVAGCAGADDPPAGSSGTAPTTIVTTTTGPGGEGPASFVAYLDPAQPVDRVAVGQRFGLLVRTDPAQGRRWRVAEPPDPALLATLGTDIATDDPRVEGAPDTQVFSFVGRAPGTTQVTLVEVQADGQGVEGSEPVTFTVVVTVDGQPPPPPTTAPPAGGDGDGP